MPDRAGYSERGEAPHSLCEYLVRVRQLLERHSGAEQRLQTAREVHGIDDADRRDSRIGQIAVRKVEVLPEELIADRDLIVARRTRQLKLGNGSPVVLSRIEVEYPTARSPDPQCRRVECTERADVALFEVDRRAKPGPFN